MKNIITQYKIIRISMNKHNVGKKITKREGCSYSYEKGFRIIKKNYFYLFCFVGLCSLKKKNQNFVKNKGI